ncbi:AsmA-like C-terminal region-containing protein [Wolbachia endosymbiont of Ctenocephalides felis wCfeT]|uniref:AsmA-like C-terminal region-containing protein n=1 Tax=Wolbachia endosymbiont of Ctenocephalides felis wCfeT TaxID=2732593 RepID=UPI0014452627|nr:AsmA-like C-terminal region-containing protein [Wolbachia endosymbiont of Ctenocephalides felis wCfeT]
MRLSIYATLSISLVLILLQIIVSFKDWNNYKERIIQELEKTYDAKVHIGGNIEVSLITPKLTVHNVYIQYSEDKEQKLSDLISADRIEIRPSLLSLFSFSLKAKSITLLGMKSNKANLLNIMRAKANSDIVDIIVKDSQLQYDSANVVNIKEIVIRRNKHFFGEINSYDFDGKVYISKSTVRVESDFINLLFTGYGDQEGLQGNLTIAIENDSNVISDMAKIFNLNFLSYITPSGNIRISSNVSINENEFTLADLMISSDSMQASGEIQNDRKNNNTNVNINFSRVDLGSMQNSSQSGADIKELLECFREAIPKDLSLNFDIKASDIQYQYKTLDDFHAKLKFTDGEVKVDTRLKFLGVNNVSYLSGNVSNNNSLSEFNGHLSVEGNDFGSFISCFFPSINIKENKKSQFTLHSKIHLAPRIFTISGIRLINGTEFLEGALKINHTKKRNIIDGEFNINNLNIDKYEYSLLSSLSKVEWLKNFIYDVNIKTNIDNFTLNDTKIENLGFLFTVEKGKLATDKVKLSGKDFDITGNAQVLVDQKYAKPLLDVNLAGNKFNGKIFRLPNLVNVKKDSRNEINQMQWSVEQFNLLDDKEDFDANVQISAEKFTTEQDVLKDFNLDAVMRNNTITFRQINYTLDQGQVFFQGYLKPDSIYTKFSILNLDAKRISKVLNIKDINGQVSLNGEIKAQGKSFRDWANSSSGEINLQAQGVVFTNVNFNSFITNLLSSKNKSEISTLANTDIYNGSTLFNSASGKANISNGIVSTSLQFGIDQASGSASSNFTLSDFSLISVFRFFFIPMGHSNPLYIDMHLDGPIWHPKMSFDIDQIFITLIGKRNS